MKLEQGSEVEITEALLESIRSLPLQRSVEHCGSPVFFSPFDLYADCRQCGIRIKVRSFSAGPDVEDVFDAVFEWMNQPGAQGLVRHRQQVLRQDDAAVGGAPPAVGYTEGSGRGIELD